MFKQGRVGFIGLGIMGKPMAKNLIKAGYELIVYDIAKGPVAELEALVQLLLQAAKKWRKAVMVFFLLCCPTARTLKKQ